MGIVAVAVGTVVGRVAVVGGRMLAVVGDSIAAEVVGSVGSHLLEGSLALDIGV